MVVYLSPFGRGVHIPAHRPAAICWPCCPVCTDGLVRQKVARIISVHLRPSGRKEGERKNAVHGSEVPFLSYSHTHPPFLSLSLSYSPHHSNAYFHAQQPPAHTNNWSVPSVLFAQMRDGIRGPRHSAPIPLLREWICFKCFAISRQVKLCLPFAAHFLPQTFPRF